MKVHSAEVKASLQGRLRRIEGQARGVQRMLDEDRDCREILQQLKAMQAAVENASDLFLRAFAKDCLLQLDEQEDTDRETVIEELLDLMAGVR